MAGISRYLLRAPDTCAGQASAKAHGATLRRDLVAGADRHNRGIRSVHLQEGWHGEQDWASVLEAATGPPVTRLTSPGLASPDPTGSQPPGRPSALSSALSPDEPAQQ